MQISEKSVTAKLQELGVEIRPRVSLAKKTSLEIGGTTDELLLRKHEAIPEVMNLLQSEGIAHRFLGGGSNLLVASSGREDRREFCAR